MDIICRQNIIWRIPSNDKSWTRSPLASVIQYCYEESYMKCAKSQLLYRYWHKQNVCTRFFGWPEYNWLGHNEAQSTEPTVNYDKTKIVKLLSFDNNDDHVMVDGLFII